MNIVSAVAVGATVFGAVTGREWLQRIAKPVIVPALALDVVRADIDPTDRALLLGGLGCATAGDVLLIDPDDDRRLVAGASAFAGMQIAYAAVLSRNGATVTAIGAVPRVAGWFAGIGLLRARSRPVATPLAAYGLTLGTATTLASDPALSTRLNVGALLFTVSDGLIVVRRTLLHDKTARAVAEGAILATYGAAQALLVDGFLALQRHDDREDAAVVRIGGR